MAIIVQYQMNTKVVIQMNKRLNFIKTNLEGIIIITVFFSIFFLSLFIPYGFSIFIVMALPLWLSTIYKKDIVIDITIAIVAIIFIIAGLFVKFKIDNQGAVIIFSLLSGYIIFKMTKIYYTPRSESINKK